MFKKLAQKALSLDQSLDIGGVDLSSLSEGEVLKYGHFAIKRLWDKFNLDEILGNKINTAKRRRFNISNAVFYMVCKHILEPDSKLGMYESQDKYLKLSELNLNHLYRSLDVLADGRSKRARKDAHDRERLIEKAEELIKAPCKIKALNKRGGRKYLTEQGDGVSEIKWQIDRELIDMDAAYDGYYAIQTSEKDLQPSEVIEAYHNLWKIEESFRIMKTTLEVRPIFHWTEKRIRGPFVLCFLSFLMIRTLEILLKEEGLSINKIREALNSLTVTKFSIKDETVCLKNKPDALANIILRKLRMKPLANITSDKEFVI